MANLRLLFRRPAAAARTAGKCLSLFLLPRHFSFPPDPDAAALRAVRNLIHFRLYYSLLLYFLLLAVLFPSRPAAMLLLMATSKFAAAYAALLRAFPNSCLLRVLDRRLVAALFAIVIFVQLLLTQAVKHLAVSMAVGVPIVFAHAVFRSRDDLAAGESAAAAAAAEEQMIVDKKDADLESAKQ